MTLEYSMHVKIKVACNKTVGYYWIPLDQSAARSRQEKRSADPDT